MSRQPSQLSGLSDYIENPTTTSENVEPAHAPTVSYESAESARSALGRLTEPETRWRESNYCQLLNGEWSFRWAERPADIPEALAAEGDWDTITVPGTWQLQDYDRPIFRNHALTWERLPEIEDQPEPPNVPEEFNPVGTYRRSVEVPADWAGDRNTFLHFEGVKSAFFVWIDGEYVGYDQQSMTPSEFDVTEHFDPGSEHTLTVQVIRFSDGSHLETQDMLRFSGIFRSVCCYSKPATHLGDYFVTTDLDSDYRDATLSIEAEFGLGDDAAGSTLVGRLYDDAGTEVATVEGAVDPSSGHTRLETEIENPAQWSAEQPNLYDLLLELRRPDGTVSEVVTHRVGFREYEIVDGRMLLNGEPITIRGVNRHEHSPESGRTAPFERTLEELRLMKRTNVNAVRTSHYPNELELYELADELGLYVIDEANVETHFNMNFVNEAPEFHRAFVERFERMLQHHKNFASIFAWSTGNEGGTGPAHDEMAAYARAVDDTRFVYHQGSGKAPYDDFHVNMTGTAPFTDISGPRYAEPHTLGQHSDVDDRPLIMGEYGHTLGNGMGLQDAYWDLVHEIDGLQGGFIWEWTNQSLEPHVAPSGDDEATPDDDLDPSDYWFNEDPFLLDGFVFSDLTPQPGVRQVKKTQQPFRFDTIAVEAGVLRVTNDNSFTDLNAYEITWELAVGGDIVQSGTLDIDVPPNQSRGVNVPFDRPDLGSGEECYLTMRVRLTEDTDWAEAGHEIGFDQFAVPFETPAPPTLDDDRAGDIAVEEAATTVTLAGPRFDYQYDLDTHQFASFAYDGTVVATDGPLFSAFRAPVPNEGNFESETDWGFDNETEWRELGLDALEPRPIEHTVERLAPDHARLTATTAMANPDGEALFEVQYRYDIYASGAIATTVDIDPTADLRERLDSWLPRLGVQFDLPESISDFEWFGRGPEETYPGRKSGNEIGRYAGTIADQFVPYRYPSDNGNKTDVRWAAATNDETGVLVYGDQPLNVRLEQYENVADVYTLGDLVERDGTTLFADIAVAGVGGTPIKPLPEHRVQPEPVGYTVVFRPFDVTETDPATLAGRLPAVERGR